MKAFHSRYSKVVIVLVAVYLAASLASAIFLAEITVHVQRRPLRHKAEFEQLVSQEFHSQWSDVNMSAADGADLKAWYVRPINANGSSVILLHGVTDNREGAAGYSRMFLHDGYSVLLPDSRAHGESGGAIATYGVKERQDIREWSEWLQRQGTRCTYLFGESMGAAIALQASAVTPRLCAVVVESPYSNFREIAYDRFLRHSDQGPWFVRIISRPTLEFAIAYVRIRYGVDLSQSSPEYAIAISQTPTLLIHGTADRNIPLRHSLRLIHASRGQAELWVVEGADHGGAVNIDPMKFEQKILGWCREHQAPSAIQ